MSKTKIQTDTGDEVVFHTDEATRLSSELNAIINDPCLTLEQRSERIRSIAKKRSKLFLRRAAPEAA